MTLEGSKVKYHQISWKALGFLRAHHGLHILVSMFLRRVSMKVCSFHCLVFILPRKTHPDMTEKLFDWGVKSQIIQCTKQL